MIDFGDLLANVSLQAGALVLILLAIANGVIKNAIGNGFVGIALFFWRKLFRKNVHTLTKDVIEHRMKIRDSLADQFSRLNKEKDGIQVLLTDVLRGGKTYDENRKFLKKYNYQKAVITDYYDKTMQLVISPGLVSAKYDARKKLWVSCKHDDPDAKSVYEMGELDYDYVVAIDWVSSKSDNLPHLYYNYRLLQPYERKYFAARKVYDERFRATYTELVGPNALDES